MDQSSASPGATAKLVSRLMELMARHPDVALALYDVLREQDDLAFRALRRRRTGDRTFG